MGESIRGETVDQPSITALANMFAATSTQIQSKDNFRSSSAAINGVYHHVSQEHLKRYLAEFDFRYSERIALDISDMERTTKAIKGIVGKRLT